MMNILQIKFSNALSLTEYHYFADLNCLILIMRKFNDVYEDRAQTWIHFVWSSHSFAQAMAALLILQLLIGALYCFTGFPQGH